MVPSRTYLRGLPNTRGLYVLNQSDARSTGAGALIGFAIIFLGIALMVTAILIIRRRYETDQEATGPKKIKCSKYSRRNKYEMLLFRVH